MGVLGGKAPCRRVEEAVEAPTTAEAAEVRSRWVEVAEEASVDEPYPLHPSSWDVPLEAEEAEAWPVERVEVVAEEAFRSSCSSKTSVEASEGHQRTVDADDQSEPAGSAPPVIVRQLSRVFHLSKIKSISIFYCKNPSNILCDMV